MTDSTLTTGAVALPDWALIHAHGPDSAAFLQGQLTQDVLTLAPDTARLAGYCSPKGRLLASAVIWRDGGGGFYLACSADVQEATLKRLKMFVLRAKCTLEADATPLYGVLGAAPAGSLALDAGRALHRGPLPADAAATHAADWAWAEVASGVPRIVAACADLFVPQMVNFELVGGVNFQKGCYPGQEVVARSQYRGTTKRRLALVRSTVPLAPAAEVFAADDPDQPAGTVVLAASRAGEHLAQVMLRLTAWTQPLRCGDAVLTVQPLPYALPGEED